MALHGVYDIDNLDIISEHAGTPAMCTDNLNESILNVTFHGNLFVTFQLFIARIRLEFL